LKNRGGHEPGEIIAPFSTKELATNWIKDRYNNVAFDSEYPGREYWRGHNKAIREDQYNTHYPTMFIIYIMELVE
jgi:hypothetical protein